MSKTRKKIEFLTATVFIIIGAASRLLDHPFNFTPITAIALFGSVYLSKRTALILPILAMLISDFFIGFYQFSLMGFVYLSFFLCVFWGFWLKKHKKWYTVLVSSLFCSIIFFLLTNFAVWAFTDWYPKDSSGFVECYLMAIPFFKNTLLGDLLYVSLFFGIYEGIGVWIRKKFKVTETAPISIYQNQK